MPKDKATRAVPATADYPFQADETGAAVLAVDHQLLRGPLALDITVERLGCSRVR